VRGKQATQSSATLISRPHGSLGTTPDGGAEGGEEEEEEEQQGEKEEGQREEGRRIRFRRACQSSRQVDTSFFLSFDFSFVPSVSTQKREPARAGLKLVSFPLSAPPCFLICQD